MESILRDIFFFLDKILYGFIPTIYNFIITLAHADIFQPGAIETLMRNIYAILGLYMVFRFAFVLLIYIIDPEKMTDKASGFGKISTKFMIALLLIVIIPWGFSLGRTLQSDILRNNVIQKLFLGGAGEITNDPGQLMGMTSLQSFLSVHPEIQEDHESGDKLDRWKEYQTGFSYAFPTEPDVHGKVPDSDFDMLSDNLNKKFDSTIKGRTYAFSYKYGLSTICGGLILFMLVTLCIDVAVRIVKLAFLEIMTPVAVAGFIEPKNQMFDKWLKMAVKIYVNLFIRIMSISFITYVMSSLNLYLTFPGLDESGISSGTRLFAQIFIIVGLLIFAKELPKILQEMFNLQEGNIMNPFKRMKDMAGAGLVGGAAGLAGSLAFGGLGRGLGALGGGALSKIRGGTFGSGAKAGKDAMAKKIPFGTKFSGKQIGGAVLGGFAGGKAGWGSAKDASAYWKNKDEENAITKKANNGVADASIFKHEDSRAAFEDWRSKKNEVSKGKGTLTSTKSAYENAQFDYNAKSDAYKMATEAFNKVSSYDVNTDAGAQAALKKVEDLNSMMDHFSSVGDIDGYNATQAEYNSYIGSASYKDATSNYSAYTAAQKTLNDSRAALQNAEAVVRDTLGKYQAADKAVVDNQKELDASEARLKSVLEAPNHADDKKTFDVYKSLRDRGKIK